MGDNQIRYLAVLRDADGTVSVARTTVFFKIPGSRIVEAQTVSFDPATGMVTAHYERPLSRFLSIGVTLPFLLLLLANILVGAVLGFAWNTPVFPLKRVPA